MSGMKRYIAWCEEKDYTNEYGEVMSMAYANEYMKSQAYDKEHRQQALKREFEDAPKDSLFGMMWEMAGTLDEYHKRK
jgi:uncharacterized tellurite resistance protein B-like protein